ncbi:hypothetical protein J051_4853 [Klebsiella pneumoniae 440_1540]|nr:hypothetical protein H251_5750 [Klebsiella pneumoniae VAKPC297]EOZ71482.1 hypothetical protein J051_4853 [Klebsiella pneumoniae 440_1540]EPO79200.1 hypothetical protein H229_5665 [Klebsiella pneumoniae UHKPC02]EPS04740.1 hypothetical protein KKPNMP14_55580 [Klebsiella pneumoniae subsp. pneumoniae MP14]
MKKSQHQPPKYHHLTFPLYQSGKEPEKALFLLKGKGMQELPQLHFYV